MDEFLMGDVLPILLAMCTDGMLSMNLPREKELLTFFSVLKSFISKPDTPVSWSVAFAMQSLLTSVFVMQGQNDVQVLGATVKKRFNGYITQITWLLQNDTMIQNNQLVKTLSSMQMLRWLVQSVTPEHETRGGGPDFNTIADRAIWNPLSSGLFMQYICYYSNLDTGLRMIDSFGQLRLVLHLYNSLIQTGVFYVCDITFIDWLHDTFKSCNAIWGGDIPKRGELVKRWWIVYGASVQNAEQAASATHLRILKTLEEGKVSSSQSSSLLASASEQLSLLPRNIRRAMAPINPEDISVSFNHICLHNFSNLESQHHTEDKSKVLIDVALRCNGTFKHMDQEHRMLASNFAIISNHLNFFLERLCDSMGWRPLLNQIISISPESVKSFHRIDGIRLNSWEVKSNETCFRRYVMASLICNKIFGAFDVEPNLDRISEQDASFVGVSANFRHFFNDILQPQHYLFFSVLTNVSDDDDETTYIT